MIYSKFKKWVLTLSILLSSQVFGMENLWEAGDPNININPFGMVEDQHNPFFAIEEEVPNPFGILVEENNGMYFEFQEGEAVETLSLQLSQSELAFIAAALLERILSLNLATSNSLASTMLDNYLLNFVYSSASMQNTFQAFVDRATNALFTQVANCSIFAEIALLLAHELHGDLIQAGFLHVFLVGGINFDHRFFVISLSPDMQTGPALVIDPWLRSYFPYEDLPHRLGEARLFPTDGTNNYQVRIISIPDTFNREAHGLLRYLHVSFLETLHSVMRQGLQNFGPEILSLNQVPRPGGYRVPYNSERTKRHYKPHKGDKVLTLMINKKPFQKFIIQKDFSVRKWKEKKDGSNF